MTSHPWWSASVRAAHRWSRRARIGAYRRLLRGLLADIASDARPYGFPTMTYPERISIGSGSTINYDVILGGRGGITVGRRVRLSSRSVLETQYIDPFSTARDKHEARPIVIEDGVDVGVGAMILAGVRVGEHSVIAAGAVVTSDVPPNSLAVGVPATVLPLRSRAAAADGAEPLPTTAAITGEIGEDAVVSRVIKWISEVIGEVTDAETPLRESGVGSLEAVELASVLEATFSVSLDGALTHEALRTPRTLARLVASRAGSGQRQWTTVSTGSQSLRTDEVLVRAASLPAGTLVARQGRRTLLIGSPRPALPADGGARHGHVIEASTGSLLAVGPPARALSSFVEALTQLAAGWRAEPVWFPLLRSPGGDEHPQQVASGHSDGILPHAVCIELLRKVDLAHDRVMAGLGCAHRREPARRVSPRGRLESYRVFEVVVCGSDEYCHRMWRQIEADVGSFLAERFTGSWAPGRDSFHAAMTRKLEWVARVEGAEMLAVASLNDHGRAFTGSADHTSFCLGVGVDRAATILGEALTDMPDADGHAVTPARRTSEGA